MAASSPILPFLRPLRLPRPATVLHFLRFSTTNRCGYAAPRESRPQEDRNLVASRKAPESYPPRSMKSLPRPKESKASRRTSHPTKERPYPTRRPSHHQPQVPKLIPGAVKLLPEDQSAPNLPYFVTRSAFNSLPIYTMKKRGGNLKLTRIKNIDGDRMKLKLDIATALGIKKDDSAINHITGHLNIKGHYKREIETFLRARRF